MENRNRLKPVLIWLKKDLTKPIPRHANWLFTLGISSLFLFIIQAVSGVLLLFYYKPSAKLAHDSIDFIMNEVRFGWLMRQIHAWGANLMIIVVLLHMLRAFFYGSYKSPREVTWMTGVLILFCVLGFGLTGYLLPWSQLSYWATTVTTEVAGSMPFIGEALTRLMRGGDKVNDYTLGRFFTIHVVVLPATLAILVAIHLFLIRLFGISPLKRTDEPEPTVEQIAQEGGKPFFPNHVLKESITVYLIFGILLSLAIFAPFELPEKANPLLTPEGIKPEWYFLAMYQSIKYVPKVVGIFGSMIFAALIFFLPLIDRSPERHPKRRPIAISIGVISILAALTFSILGYLSGTTKIIFGTRYHFDIKAIPHKENIMPTMPTMPTMKKIDEEMRR
jgi:quinol-cytochrome oxidoreductase complex cytochrome b subunit